MVCMVLINDDGELDDLGETLRRRAAEVKFKKQLFKELTGVGMVDMFHQKRLQSLTSQFELMAEE